MSIRLSLAATALTALAAPAFANGHSYGGYVSVPIFSYQTNANFCPSGLQPIVLNGVICCGTPNAGSYQSMMQEPVRRAAAPVYYDNEGIKGNGG